MIIVYLDDQILIKGNLLWNRVQKEGPISKVFLNEVEGIQNPKFRKLLGRDSETYGPDHKFQIFRGEGGKPISE
jgi:hypothetical protein